MSSRDAFLASSLTVVMSMAIDGCNPAPHLLPAAPTYAAATGGQSCRVVESYGNPLVVDWSPEQRTDLEATMARGIAVVHYDCHTLELLPDCRLEGTYGFIGVTSKEHVLRLTTAADAEANLPLNGLRLGASVRAGTSLDIAMMLVGKRATTALDVPRDALKGHCDGATHFVRDATVGAFAMSTGSSAEVRAAADVFQASASASSASERSVATKDGDLRACSEARLDAARPPEQCGALVRLHLVAIAPATKPSVAQAEDMTCPEGMVFSDGKCTGSHASPHLCKRTDPADCRLQCDRGEFASCRRLGSMYYAGDAGLNADVGKARELFQLACDHGDPGGCHNLGRLYLNGEAGLAVDVPRGAAFIAQACDAGDAHACGSLAILYAQGKGIAVDPARAAGLARRACDGADAQACYNLGVLTYSGEGGLTADIPKAMELFRRACSGGEEEACKELSRSSSP